jgi:putative DNA primase/helicase
MMKSTHVVIEAKTLMSQAEVGRATPELMCLPGARLCQTSESKTGDSLCAPLIKKLTGGDGMKIRQLNQPEIKFTMRAIICMATNHEIELKDITDTAMTSRVTHIPCTSKESSNAQRIL